MQKLILILLLVSVCADIFSQELKQNIKGRIIDMDSHMPLPGVNVVIMGSYPPVGGTTDAEGFYVIENVTVGRYSLQYTFMGYETVIRKEIVVGSARETELNIQMRESFQQLQEVVVKSEFQKDKPQNKMTTLSARSFSVEEASRYAGGWNDPSRLAGSFAGVTMAEGVNDNAIVVRGNAPKGILWKLEGVEIPTPNHLSGVNNGGGYETVFSVNMLSNSDFLTGAFPAEYGNAISGVFDMKFRNGNSNRRESSIQVGTQGIDISSEGPLNAKHKSSYLFNYRYSTLGLATYLVGDDFGLPVYQDISFNFNFPLNNGGYLSFWGIGGLSEVAFIPDEDVDAWTNSFNNNKYKTGSNIGVAGLTYHQNIGKSSYIKSALAFSYDDFSMKSDQLQKDGTILPIADHKENTKHVILDASLNIKISKHITSKSGIGLYSNHYVLNISGNENPGVDNMLLSIANETGSTTYGRIYTQFKWRVTPVLDINTGFNLTGYSMNNEWVYEPRAGVNWRFLPKQSLSFAYGLHSRLEPLRFYLQENDAGSLLNSDLKITKARHYVLAYDYNFNEHMHFKIESYFQEIYDVPVVKGSSESLINYTWDMYFDEPLINAGSGKNKGIDITIERYMSEGYYYMLTGTVFDSKYIGGDGVERNTSFNRGFVFNLLGGKEWNYALNNIFSINAKIAYMGGNRFTPPDQELSQINELVVLDESRAYEWQENNKLFVDLAFSYRVNKKSKAHVFTLQGKNILLQKEMFGWAYDFEKDKVIDYGTATVYPYFTYRFEF